MTCDTLLTLRGTWGFYQKYVHQSLSLRLIEYALHNVFLEHGGLYIHIPGVLGVSLHQLVQGELLQRGPEV